MDRTIVQKLEIFLQFGKRKHLEKYIQKIKKRRWQIHEIRCRLLEEGFCVYEMNDVKPNLEGSGNLKMLNNNERESLEGKITHKEREEALNNN